MKIDNSLFKQKLPEKGYHVPGGKIAHDIKKGFSFICGCGAEHSTRQAFAVREHKEEGTAIYSCPHDDHLLNLVEPVGIFRVKGIQTIASFLADDTDEVYQKIFAYRDMSEMGVSTLREYFSR
jgi:hypothetical protein